MEEGPEKNVADVPTIIVSQVGDDDYVEVARKEDVEIEISEEEFSVTAKEASLVTSVASLGFEFVSCNRETLIFLQAKNLTREDMSLGRRRPVLRSNAESLLSQLGDPVVEHPTFKGVIIPSRGYIEIILRSRVSPLRAINLFRLDVGNLDCKHRDPTDAMPTLAFRNFGESDVAERRIHLSGSNGNPCIEVSNASPLAMLYYGRTLDSGRLRVTTGASQTIFLPSVKLDFGMSMTAEQIILKSDELTRSLLYELDVRNALVMSMDVPTRRRGAVDHPGSASTKVRYPRTKVEYEVASLFSFASEAIGDPPLAFLSYYQALEYFIPAAVRQSALKDVKRELRDPSFDEDNNDCLLRIVAAAGGSISAAESSQFRILVNEYVRISRLEEFFDNDWGSHFSKRGPVKGVNPININPQSATPDLTNQVADRIYQIRNRIVHAKDDPRYGNARVLLPRSGEANALRPDVMLVRLLASEAIVTSQG